MFAIVGEDPFGREMTRIMPVKGVVRDGVLVQMADWDTPVYIKPIREDHEENRLDFGNFNQLHDDVAAALLARLEAALPGLDVVIISQQLRCGLHTATVQAGVHHPRRPNANRAWAGRCCCVVHHFFAWFFTLAIVIVL